MLLQIRESMDAKTIILIVLIAAILLILFVPAVIRDRLQKRRGQNRAGMDSADHAESFGKITFTEAGSYVYLPLCAAVAPGGKQGREDHAGL